MRNIAMLSLYSRPIACFYSGIPEFALSQSQPDHWQQKTQPTKQRLPAIEIGWLDNNCCLNVATGDFFLPDNQQGQRLAIAVANIAKVNSADRCEQPILCPHPQQDNIRHFTECITRYVKVHFNRTLKV